LQLLRDSERKLIVESWNETARPYPSDRAVHQVFEEQAESTPNAVAVSFEGEVLTYRELNEQANQVARRLQSLGVRHGDLVGLCMARGSDLIVATVGILKAGAAYVPLSTTDPSERLTFMLHDTKVSVVIAQRQVFQELQHQVAHVVRVDSDRDSIRRLDRSNLDVLVSGEDRAYVMYTSGSTGQPKGVVVPHRAVNRLVCNTNFIDLGPSDRVAQVSNVTFDAVTLEIWGALLNGARLDIIPQEVMLSPLEFSKRLREDRITTIWMTTALFNQYVQEMPDAFGTLKHLLFGGEMADARRVRQLLSTNPPERLLNGYGPTESTTFATWHLVEEVPDDATTVPIGKPIANTTVYVLDRNMQPVPIGLPGEIYIGGDGLALEYWDRPELTQEKFVSNPFSADPDAKLYKTGDQARYMQGGVIEFLQRNDDQIKIRGFRVEPGEIENALNQHPAIHECVVLAHSYNEQAEGGAKGTIERLVAYVVPKQTPSPDTSDLRLFLRELVPDYMVPSAFVPLDELPVNSNGKVDRQALMAPDPKQFKRGSAFIEPSEEVHWQLRDLWVGALNMQHMKISLDDNFFELGGHSLLAVSLLARVNQFFGKNLTVTTLFEAPTILELSEVIKEQGWQPTTSSVIPIQPHGSLPTFFFIGGSLAMCYRLASVLGKEQPIYVVRRGRLNFDRLAGDQLPFPQLKEFARQFVRDIEEIQPQGPCSVAGHSFDGTVAMEIAQLLKEKGHQVPLLALLDTWRPGYRPEGRISQDEKSVQASAPRQKTKLGRRFALGLIAMYYKLRREWYSPTVYRLFHALGWPVPRALQNLKWVRRDAISKAVSFDHIPYDGRVTLFRAMEPDQRGVDDDFGWSQLVPGGVEIVKIPGDHLAMTREPNLQVLVSKLAELVTQSHGSDESVSEADRAKAGNP
jgi:amino acid adenylation domain-containing protein